MLNLNLTHLFDDAKCSQQCASHAERRVFAAPSVVDQASSREVSCHSTEHQRYQYKRCNVHFDNLRDTIFAGHHQPLRMWLLCLHRMDLNRSHRQIAQALNRDKDVVHDHPTAAEHCSEQTSGELS